MFKKYIYIYIKDRKERKSTLFLHLTLSHILPFPISSVARMQDAHVILFQS